MTDRQWRLTGIIVCLCAAIAAGAYLYRSLPREAKAASASADPWQMVSGTPGLMAWYCDVLYELGLNPKAYRLLRMTFSNTVKAEFETVFNKRTMWAGPIGSFECESFTIEVPIEAYNRCLKIDAPPLLPGRKQPAVQFAPQALQIAAATAPASLVSGLVPMPSQVGDAWVIRYRNPTPAPLPLAGKAMTPVTLPGTVRVVISAGTGRAELVTAPVTFTATAP